MYGKGVMDVEVCSANVWPCLKLDEHLERRGGMVMKGSALHLSEDTYKYKQNEGLAMLNICTTYHVCVCVCVLCVCVCVCVCV